MQLNMQRESGEFQQTSSSDDGHSLVALRKLVKKEVADAFRQEFHQELHQELPAIRKMVKEEIQSALSGGIRNCANEMTVSRERSLQLKFSDEVSLPVLTGKVLLGITGKPMMVSLIDSTTGEVVDCEPESSAKVEMLLLDANDDDKERNWSVEDFNNRIISEDDKEKPHLAKNAAKYIHLKKGVGTLCKLKLGHGSRWMKSCKCRLAARVVENFRGNEVKEGLTESFVVSDSRSKLYGKHHPPLPSDEVWRLENISKDGAPCRHLNEENIRTVQDFLFLHNVDPQTLQQKFGARSKTWKETVDHARSCTIDDEKLYLHHPCAESKMSVVFDAVGGLKGLVVNQSNYAPIDNLSADEKDCAHKLLLSAFENREERTSFDDEASLLHQFPYRPSDIDGRDPMIAEIINHYIPTEPGSSSLSISPYMMTPDLHHNTINPSMDTNNWIVPFPRPSSSQSIYQSGSVESPGTRQLNESIHLDALLLPLNCQFSDLENISRYDPTGEGTSSQGMIFGICSPGLPTTGPLHEANIVCGSWSPTSLLNPNTNGLSETLSHDRSRAFRLVGCVVKEEVVKEELDSAIRTYIMHMKRNCGKDAHSSESRSLCLQFGSAISLPVFTGTRIEGEGCTQLEVALIDLLTGEVVSSGLGSSAKVEVVVLEGDFDAYGRDNWTLEEFQNNTVRERDGKKPLLTGDLIMNLQDGKGLVGNVMFTDNSRWTRSRKFRLGARLLDSIGGISKVREARSEPFVVRDHRGELYKKHHPPSLSDEVWRLEKIGKDGAFHKRLRKESVNTVEDFLVSLSVDPTRLRNILGTGMSAKMWEVVVEHARTCVLDQKLYFYGASQKNGVVFNVVGQVMGSISNGQYLDADELSEAQKTEARELVISAFADREKIVSFDDGISPNLPASSKSLSIAQSSSNLLSETTIHDDLSSSQNLGGSSFLQQNASSPDYMQSLYSVEGLSSFEDCLHHVDPVEIRCDQDLDYPGQVADSLLCNADTLNQTFCAYELHYFDRDCVIQSSHLELSADIQGAIAAYIPCSDISIDKAQRGWKILVFVLRWWFSIKRRLMARKTRV